MNNSQNPPHSRASARRDEISFQNHFSCMELLHLRLRRGVPAHPPSNLGYLHCFRERFHTKHLMQNSTFLCNIVKGHAEVSGDEMTILILENRSVDGDRSGKCLQQRRRRALQDVTTRCSSYNDVAGRYRALQDVAATLQQRYNTVSSNRNRCIAVVNRC